MATGWERRNERARELGYKDAYDYRAHGYGARAPSEPKFSGEELARLRGHRGERDLAAIASRIETLNIQPAQRNKAGQWTTATVLVTMKDGTTREYTLRGKNHLGKEPMRRLHTALSSGMAGAGPIVDIYHMFGETDDVDAYEGEDIE